MRRVRTVWVRLWVRLWRARARVFVAWAALITSVRHLHGWWGWAVGAATAVGVILIEFRRWWDYVITGTRDVPEALEPRPAGSARFREKGTTTVRLLSIGDRPEVVARRLRLVTDLDPAAISDLLASVPTVLPTTVSLRSAELVVAALRDAGADCQLHIQGILEPGQSV